MITDIKQYLAPLTNNERGLLIAAANGRALYGSWVERTQSVEADLSPYRRGSKRIPDGQKDKAILGLVEKGYATIVARRGNYVTRNGYWKHTSDGETIYLGREAAPMHKILTEKMNGSTQYRIDLWRLVQVVPTENVKAAIASYQQAKEDEARLEIIAKAQRADLRQREKEMKMLRLCQQYVAKYGEQSDYASPISGPNENGWYEVDNLIADLERAAKNMEKWRWERRTIERDAAVASEKIAEQERLVAEMVAA
mgnify:CR=1 FL=1